MNTKIIFLFTAMFNIASLFSQTKEKQVFSFCNENKTIAFDELTKCGQLTCNDKKIKIKSYMIGISAPLKFENGTWDSTNLVVANIAGAYFKTSKGYVNQDAKDIINHIQGTTLYVLNIIIIENHKEEKIPSFNIFVK